MRLALLLACLASPALAADCLFSATSDAGIPGFNDEVITTASAAACMTACSDRSWCRSVDYERGNGTCYLQSAGRHDAALKRDYAGNPYDHYTCETRLGGESTSQGNSCAFVLVRDAGIPGHNDEVLNGVALSACQAACVDREWCKSVDYERGPGTCYLQGVSMYEAELRRDYPGNPYDHYTCSTR